ncbi:MAG: hypothetical protein A2Z38_02470 [Planctomycetes bacterium RBG_19FT_COMBO_48_8]|nr:MAG: hypothetical protein A2Z38_02470 [Planctomycetes bacterium RBG_19FT_COMBO_48_8]
MNQEVSNLLLRPRRKYLLIAVLLAYLARPLWGEVRQSQISQFGITWTFDKDYTVGQFANGDYWVVGPVTIIRIQPASVEVNSRTINGSMVNPSPRLEQTQGYDSATYGRYARSGDYDPSLNVARPNGKDLSKDNPLILQPNSSLVSAMSTPEADSVTQLKAVAVLTVLNAPAPDGSFRPAYCGSDKTIRFNQSRLDFSLLASLKPVAGTPALSAVERYYERPWLDHVGNWMGRSHHPVDNMPDYGREMATQIGVGALMLHLNFSSTQKEKLLVRYVQLGIDLYGIVQDGGEKNWTANGGHASGRKWPILFAGLVLNDPNMKNIGRPDIPEYGPSHPEYVHFGEDDQTFYVTQADVDITHGSLWGPDRRDAQKIPYEQEDIGLPEWGIVHADSPESSNKFWSTAYRQVSSPGWGGFILAAHIMGAKELWNHDALFDYKDRYMQVDADWKQTSRFVLAMWDTYRKDYTAVWTMSPMLNITAVGGTVAKVPDKAAYTLGERISIKAVPDPGYEFISWSGAFSEKINPAVIIMHSNRSITANFIANPSANGSICDKTVCGK